MESCFSFQAKRRKPPAFLVDCKFSGYGPPIHIEVLGRTTIDTLRYRISDAVRGLFVGNRVSSVDRTFVLVHKGQKLVNLSSTMNDYGLIEGSEIMVCDPDEFELRVNRGGRSYTITIATHHTIEQMKLRIWYAFGFYPKSLYVLSSKGEWLEVTDGCLVDFGIWALRTTTVAGSQLEYHLPHADFLKPYEEVFAPLQ